MMMLNHYTTELSFRMEDDINQTIDQKTLNASCCYCPEIIKKKAPRQSPIVKKYMQVMTLLNETCYNKSTEQTLLTKKKKKLFNYEKFRLSLDGNNEVTICKRDSNVSRMIEALKPFALRVHKLELFDTSKKGKLVQISKKNSRLRYVYKRAVVLEETAHYTKVWLQS